MSKRQKTQTRRTAMTSPANPFNEPQPIVTPDPASVTVTEPTTPTPEATETPEHELAEVDTPEALDDETDIVPAGAKGTPEGDAKEKAQKAKEAKAPARPPVPEGFVTPVAFAKLLTDHLRAAGTLEADKIIAPQMVYSYMKNADPTKAGVKNPWSRYSEGGRENLLKVDESLAWWDAKNERVSASRKAAAEKAAKKVTAAQTSKQAAEETGEVATGPVEEAE